MITDTNAYLSRWPFRRLPDDTPERLIARLQKNGVTKAWAGSFDAVLHRDVGAVNANLAAACREAAGGFFVPFGTVNPTLPDWEEDLRRCAEEFQFPGVRLHPNYHGYKLDDDRFRKLLVLADEANLLVQISVKMEDERTQHPLVQVPEVDVAPLVELLPKFPKLNVMLVNSLRTVRGALLRKLATTENVFFEISMLEGVGGVGRLLETVPYKRVLFGSYAPFFYAESAVLKMRESELGETIRGAILQGNAEAVQPIRTANDPE